jgi:hypothetical protein
MKLLEIEIEIGISTKETKDSNGKLVTITETVEKIKQNSIDFLYGVRTSY